MQDNDSEILHPHAAWSMDAGYALCFVFNLFIKLTVLVTLPFWSSDDQDDYNY